MAWNKGEAIRRREEARQKEYNSFGDEQQTTSRPVDAWERNSGADTGSAIRTQGGATQNTTSYTAARNARKLASDWLNATADYMRSGKLDASKREALNKQYNGIGNYLKTWGKDIGSSSMKEIQSAMDQAYGMLNQKPNDGRLVRLPNYGEDNTLAKTPANTDRNPVLVNLPYKNYQGYGNIGNELNNNITLKENAAINEYNNYLKEQEKYSSQRAREIVNADPTRVSDYDKAAQLSEFINAGGDITGLSDSDRRKAEDLLNYWSKNEVNRAYQGRVNSQQTTNPMDKGQVYNDIPVQEERLAPLRASTNQLLAAAQTAANYRRSQTINGIMENDPDTKARYWDTFNADRGKLGDAYLAAYATEEEGLTYALIKDTEGQEAADTYMRQLKGELVNRKAANQIRTTQSNLVDVAREILPSEMWGTGDEIARGVGNLYEQLKANATTVVGSFASPVTYLPGLGETRQNVADTLAYANAIKSQNTQQVAGDNKLARILWEGASSGIENVVEAAAAGQIADAIGLGTVNTEALKSAEGTMMGEQLKAQQMARDNFISTFVTLGMSSGATMTAVEEGKAKGYTADEAAIRGLVSGAIEFMTEKVGMDGVFKAVKEGKGALMAILKSGLAEGSEELVANNLDRLATAIADAVTKKDVPEYQQKVIDYIKQGMSETEAMQKVMLDYVDEDVEAFASAFFSAGMSAAGMGALTGADIRDYVNQHIDEIIDSDNNVVDQEALEALIETGMSEEFSKSTQRKAEALQQKLDNGEEITQQEVKALYRENVKETSSDKFEDVGEEPVEESVKAPQNFEERIAEMKTLEGLKQLKNTLGNEGQKLFDNAINEAIRNKADVAQAYKEVTNVYNAGAGVTNTYTAIHLTADTTQALYKAGIADRETYAAKEANNKLMKNVSAGIAETPALTQAIADGRISTKTRDVLDSLGKKLGARIEIYNSNAEYNGQYNPNDSTIRLYLDSTLLKSADTDTILRATAGHEITHRLQSLSSKHYESLVKTVADTMGSEFSNAVNKYKAKDNRLSNAQAQDEVIADFVGRKIFTDDAFLDRLVNNIATSDTTAAEKKSALQSLKDFFHKIASWIRGNKVTDVSIDRIREIENKIDSIIKAGVENLKNAETFDGIREQLQSVGANATEGAIVKDSIKSWDETDISKLKQMLKVAGFGTREINKWIRDVNGVAATVLADRTRLDYDADEFQSALKPNAEYFYTLDLSTLCKKRQLYQGTYNAIMHRLQNAALMPEDTISLRAMMAEMGYEVPCGICYEESRKKNEGKFAKRWLEGYGKKWKGYKNIQHNDPYIPTLNQVTTTDGREWLRKNHPEALESYLNYQKTRGSANPKVSMTHTDYRGDILRMTDNDIENVKHIGGLRIQSFSDFETVHVIDMMQAVMDMSARKLTAQAYTKVPAFADIFGGTGIKINLSLIGKVNENGVLEFDAKEGMNPDEAFRLRNKYSKNVGTILVGANDESILAAWADDRIDMVIPFHRSGWGKAEFEKLGLVGYKDFTKGQTERYMMGKKDMALSTASKALGLTGDQKLEGIYAEDYWDYNKSGKENAEAYLELCAEKHYRPVFYQFLHDNGDGTWSLQPDGSTDGYWKSLIDFKMYDNKGNGARQQEVKPVFDMKAAQDTMKAFDGNPNTLPVAQDVVDRFVKEYNANHKNVKNSVKDTEYMDAVNKGDMETAQKMVDQAAKEAGYDIKAYHGTLHNFTTFDETKNRAANYWGNGFYFTNSEDEARNTYANRNSAENRSKQAEGKTSRVINSYLKIANPYVVGGENEATFAGVEQDRMIKALTQAMHSMYSATDITNFDGVAENFEWLKDEYPDGFTSYELHDEMRTLAMFLVDGEGIENKAIRSLGYDGIIAYPEGQDFQNNYNATHYILFDNTDVKSADPVTYDDNGNVIPLSERFNESNPDIRYSAKDNGYHAGDLGKAESLFNQSGGRSTGHFGTGTYFVGNQAKIEGYNTRNGQPAPVETADFSQYNLFKPRNYKDALALHDFMKYVDDRLGSYEGAKSADEYNELKERLDDAFYEFDEDERSDAEIIDEVIDLAGKTIGQYELVRTIKEHANDPMYTSEGSLYDANGNEVDPAEYLKGIPHDDAANIIGWISTEAGNWRSPGLRMAERYEDWNETFADVANVLGITEDELRNVVTEASNEVAEIRYPASKTADSIATRVMKKLGYEGVDVRHINEMDNTTYGSVIYDLKGADLARKQEIGTARFSRKGSPQIDYDTAIQLQQMNKALQAEVQELRDQFKRRPIDVNDFSQRITRTIRGYQGTVDAQEIIDSLLPAARKYVKDMSPANEAKLYNLIQDAAQKIVSTALAEDEFSEAKQVRDFLKGRRIKVSPKTRNDFGDWMRDYHRKYFGNIYFTTDKGTSVEDTYSELQQQFGEGMFPSSIQNPSDQLEHILEIYEAAENIYHNPYDGMTADAIESVTYELMANILDTSVKHTFADKQYEKREQLRKEMQAKANERIAALRADKNQKIEDIKAHYREMAQNKREARAEREARRQLLTIAGRLERMKTTKANRALIESLIGDLDTISLGITGKRFESLRNLRQWYLDAVDSDPDFMRDTNIENAIERLQKRHINGISRTLGTYKTLGEAKQAQATYDGDGTVNISKNDQGYVVTAHENVMNIDDVRQLLDVLKFVENEIQTAKHLIDTEDRRDTFELAQQIIYDVQHASGVDGVIGDFDKFIVQGTLSPERALRRYTGYVDNDPLYLATKNLSKGQRDMLSYRYRANQMFLKYTSDGKFMDEITGKKAKAIKVNAKDLAGNSVEVAITPAMRISLYLHSLNAQNLKHIVVGGLTVPGWDDYTKGRMDKAYGQHSTKIRLTPSQIRSITSQMTAKERSFARTVYDYFNGMSQEEINAVSEKLKGYSLAQVQDYFPINTDSNFLRKEYGQMETDGTVQGMGFLKERIEGADNPVRLRDVNAVLMQSIDMTSKYVGMAIPVSNMNKLINSQTGTWNEEKNRWETTTTVKETLKNKWGDKANEYIRKMMTDVQNPQDTQTDFDKMFSKIRSNYAGAVLTLNLSVAMKQAASYPTAAAVVGWAPLVKAMTQFGSVDLDLIASYTPLQWYRTQGYSTQELGDIKTRGKLMSNLPKALNWIQAVDLLTTRKLWKAAEIYVSDNNKALKYGTDEYYKEVANVYNQIIEETQPNYTAMQRPELLRSNSAFTQAITMFKTQPFQNFNVTFDAVANYIAKRKANINLNTEQSQKEFDQAKKRLSWALTSQAAQLFTFAAMTFLWNALRGKWKKYKDEEDNLTAGSVSAGIAKDMASSLFSEVPFGAEAWQWLSSKLFGDTYYGFDSVSVSALNDMVDSFNKASTAIGKYIKGEKDEDGEETKRDLNALRLALDTTMKSITKVFGVPYENVENLFNIGFMNIATRLAPAFGSNKYEGQLAYLKLTVDPNKYKSDYYDNLIAAYDSGDKEAYEEIYNEMAEMPAFGTEKLDKKMNEYLKGKYDLKITPSKYEGMDVEDLKKISDALVKADSNNENPEKRNESFDQNEIYNALMSLALDKRTAEKVWANEYGGNTTWDEYVAKQQATAEAVDARNKALDKVGLTPEDFETYISSMDSVTQPNAYAVLEDSNYTTSQKRTLWTYSKEKPWGTSYDDYVKSQQKKSQKKVTKKEEPKKEEPKEEPKNEGYVSLGSSWIAGIEYDNATGTLQVTTNRGYTYTHKCDYDTYQAFKNSSSPGSFYNSHFK